MPSIPVSTCDAVRDYLVMNIGTQVADGSVLVCYDAPGTFQPDDIIAVGDITIDQTLHAFVGSLGIHSMWEHYTVAITVSVARDGDDPKGTFKRAKALSDAIDTMVRTDPTMGGLVTTAYPSRAAFVADVVGNFTGRMVTITKEITVEAES